MVDNQETKETIQKVTKPFVDAGKYQIGSSIYTKAARQSGLKGIISKELASFLRKKGWYK